MMPGRHHLFVPGPTNLPDEVLRAMHRASEDHRGAAFPALVRPLLQDLARLFQTERSRVAIFPSSGTGGWEAALSNTLSPGDRVLLPCAGQFATLWGATARQLGLDVVTVEGMEWGDAPSPAAVAESLAADRAQQIRAVLLVHNETATGVTADLPAIRAAINESGHPALLFVDGVSSIGSIPFCHDAWGVDIAITGSQKGLMLPAGLALMAVSPRALAAAQSATLRRSYFDLAAMLGQLAEGYFPYTPSVPMLYGLRASLDRLFAEGMEHVFARHARLAAGVRAAVAAWGLGICCRVEGRRSDTVTTVLTPPGVDGRALIRHAGERYDLSLGAGLGPLAGKAFRIGHLGDLNEGMLLGALGLIEMTLLDFGVDIAPGCGVAAAELEWQGGGT